jgi:hypothetical protein
MTYLEEIAAIRRSLVAAEAECRSCRIAGTSDKYLEAYGVAEALELELNQRLRAGK